MTSNKIMAAALLLVLHGAASAQGAVPPPAAATCLGCHGPAGQGNAASGFPRLAGLPSSYIAVQLADFASGARNSAVMSPIAKSLPDGDRAAVASYFASLPVAADAQPAPAATAPAAGLGEKLALEGNWNSNVPACVSCHGDHRAAAWARASRHWPASPLCICATSWLHGRARPARQGHWG